MPKSRIRKKISKKKRTTKRLRPHRFSTGTSVSELERLSASGTKVLAEHLGMRMALRRSRVSSDHDLLPQEAWEFLSQVPKADTLLEGCSRAKEYKESDASSNGWQKLMRRDLQSYVNVVQHLRSGLDYAFLIGARAVFERWTTNRALSLSLEKQPGESDSGYYSRVWEELPNPSSELPGKLWAHLSEILHGRADMNKISQEYANLFGQHNRPVLQGGVASIALRLGYMASPQMLAGLDIHAKARGVTVEKGFILGRVHCNYEDSTWSELKEHLEFSTYPSDVFILNISDSKLENLASAYRKIISSPNAINVLQNLNMAIHLTGCLAHHRVFQLDRERRNLEVEIRKGDQVSIEEYGSRLYRFAAFSEMALLLGSQDDSYESVALRTAGMALDSAWRLWLDDDDLSIACMRAVFEQTSRAKVHRLKSSKAMNMETRNQRPQRWLEAAGYNRLSPIGRALGEFSHYTAGSMREDARRLITQAQEDESSDAPHTARGNLLTQGSYFLATEIAERLKDFSPHLHREFLQDVALVELHDNHELIEDYLTMVHGKKEFKWSIFDFSH